jgi:O-antigen ligase
VNSRNHPGLRIALAVLAGTAVIILGAFVRTPHASSGVRIAVAGLFVLSALAPGPALLIFAGLSPFTTVLGPLTGSTIPGDALAEALALAVLGGWLVRLIRAPQQHLPVEPSLVAPALLFAAVVTASCLVQLPEVALQSGGTSVLLGRLWAFVSRDYFLRSAPLDTIVDAATLLEALGLMLMAVSICRADETMRVRLPRMMLVGGAGSAALNVSRLVGAAIQTAAPLAALAHLATAVRVSMHYDRNAAGSVYAMLLVAGIPHATGGWRRSAIAGSCVALVAAGLWLTGSRTAIAAAVVGAMALGGAAAWRHGRRSTRLALLGTAAAAAVGLLIAATYPAQRNPSVASSVAGRRELAIAAAHMFKAHPVFGVGVGRFYDLSDDYGRAELLSVLPAANPRENAHNNLLQVLAELGLAGLVSLCWLLWQALRSPGRDGSLVAAGVKIGAVTFMLTWLTGHPLLVPEAAYAFFTMLGVAAAPAAIASRHRKPLQALAIAAIAALTIALPFRIVHAARTANLEHVGYGVSGWRIDSEVDRFRYAAADATIFAPSGAGSIQLPLRRPPGAAPAEVEIRMDGRLVNRVVVSPDAWRTLHMIIPPAPSGYRRLDVRVVTAPRGDGSLEHLMIGKLKPARVQ